MTVTIECPNCGSNHYTIAGVPGYYLGARSLYVCQHCGTSYIVLPGETGKQDTLISPDVPENLCISGVLPYYIDKDKDEKETIYVSG